MKSYLLKPILIFTLLLGGWVAKSQVISLTQEETEYIKDKGVITIANEMDWPPFDYVEDNIPTGYTIELIELVAAQTGFEIEFVNQLTWTEILEEFRKGKIDVLPAVYEDEERKEWMLFSRPYFTQPTIIAHHSSIEVNDLGDLIGKKVAVIKGFSITTELKENYPEIIYIEVDNALEGLKKVSSGEADAILESIGAVSYLLNDTYLPNISINADVELPNMDAPALHMSVLKNNPILLSIVQKGLDGLDKEDVNQLKKKWFPLMVDRSDQNSIGQVDESLFSWWYVLYASLVLIFIVFATRFILNKYVSEQVALEFGSTKFRVKTYIFLSVVSVLIIIMGYFSITYIKHDILKQVEVSLENDLDNSNKRLDFWLEQKTIQLNTFGKDALLVELTSKLLNSNSVNDSVEFKEIASKIKKHIKLAGCTGYYLVDKNGNIITSSYSDHQKQANNILKDHPDYISTAFKGKSVFIPPLSKELKVGFPPELRDITLMYISSPIVNSNGDVIAVLVHHINPIGEISEVLKLSQVGTTGESYLFDKDAEIITKSRFQNDLEKLAYFDKNPLGQLIIQLRNPGVDITSGSKSKSGTEDLPYTFMAEQALKGKAGVNVEGYPDYRGVEVFGSWRWLDDLNMGLASEMDSEEALQTYYFIRNAAIIVLAATIVLLVVIVLFTVVLGEKANKALLSAKADLENQVKERTKELQLQSTALESAANGIVITNTNGIVEWVNSAFTKLTGFDSIDVIGKKPNALKSGVHDNAFYKNMWDTIKSGKVWSGTVTNKKKDGSIYQEEMTITPVRNEKGDLTHFIAIKQDITERIELEAKIKLNEERLSLVMQGANDGIWDIKLDTGEIYINDRFLTMLGFEAGELEPTLEVRRWLTHPDDKEVSDEMFEECIAGKREIYSLESKFRCKSGDYLWVLATGRVTKYDENGVPLRFSGTNTDISERKKLELALERANARMSGELNVAKDIQMSMLPLIFPAFPKRMDIDIFASLIPAREVGGDFYDFFFIDESHLGFVVGDVSGKGVPAALMMAVCKTLVKSNSRSVKSTSRILTWVNNEMAKENANAMFVTVFLGILNTATGELTYTNAGHNPTYIKRVDGSVDKLSELHGLVIAAMEGIQYKESKAMLNPGDVIFAYTDGIPEAHNRSDELYSDERLYDKLVNDDFISVQKTVQDVISSVSDFEDGEEQFDDITALSVEFRGVEGYKMKELIEIKNKIEEVIVVNDRFSAFAERLGLPEGLDIKMSIVFDELLTNVINYAFEDNEEHIIHLEFKKAGNNLIITIEDDGVPFNPFHESPPDTSLSIEERKIGGLGIHLVKNLMDEFGYLRHANMNIVTLTKKIV
jgi:PAS domain S-box-containing protein